MNIETLPFPKYAGVNTYRLPDHIEHSGQYIPSGTEVLLIQFLDGTRVIEAAVTNPSSDKPLVATSSDKPLDCFFPRIAVSLLASVIGLFVSMCFAIVLASSIGMSTQFGSAMAICGAISAYKLTSGYIKAKQSPK